MTSKPVTKKLINSPSTCVDDNLLGLVATYPRLRLHPKHRVVTVRNDKDSGRVAVISGGGSGHEPFAAAFVGSGMLDGAVSGGIFASPPTGHVFYAINHLHKYNSGGAIVILGNYTGDRLNFGKAIEKAKIAGIKVKEVIVGEDIASCDNKTGGRGLCAEVYLFKMCGAMSAKGYDLDSIHKMAVDVCNHVATLGVCLNPCSLPGQPPLFEIAQDEMELGAGVHGEAGIAKIKLGTAREVTATLLDKITAHLKVAAGDRVTVMLNNLGGTSILEINIMCKEIKYYLTKHNIKMERIYAGHMKSSLEMHGLHISLIKLSKENGDFWLELLDAPTDAPEWTGTKLSVAGEGDDGDKEDDIADSYAMKVSGGPLLTSSQQDLFRGCLQAAGQALVNSEVLLNKLDSGCGDGDCGTTIKNFAKAILDYIQQGSVEYPSSVLWVLSEIAEKDMGGTSGGIYSLGLAAASQSFAESKTADVSCWLAAWESGMAAITKYGGAEPGDRTMLDTLHTAAVAFKQNMTSDLKTLLQKIGEAAEAGAKATANMEAKAGRASYVASTYTKDEDAGARAVAVWLQAIVDFIVKQI